MKRLIRLFFTLIFLSGCIFDRTPPGVVPKKEMIRLLTDIHLADTYTSMLGQDTAKQHTAGLYRSIFNKYNTDSANFKLSMEYYSKKPDEFHAMYKIIQANLEKLEEEQVRKFAEKSKAKE